MGACAPDFLHSCLEYIAELMTQYRAICNMTADVFDNYKENYGRNEMDLSLLLNDCYRNLYSYQENAVDLANTLKSKCKTLQLESADQAKIEIENVESESRIVRDELMSLRSPRPGPKPSSFPNKLRIITDSFRSLQVNVLKGSNESIHPFLTSLFDRLYNDNIKKSATLPTTMQSFSAFFDSLESDIDNEISKSILRSKITQYSSLFGKNSDPNNNFWKEFLNHLITLNNGYHNHGYDAPVGFFKQYKVSADTYRDCVICLLKYGTLFKGKLI